MKSLKTAFAFVIYKDSSRKEILVVKRPEDDELPGIWDLPATTMQEQESMEEAVVRGGREKLDVELKPVRLLNTGTQDRKEYFLILSNVEAEIVSGSPDVKNAKTTSTKYTDWKWSSSEILKDGAEKGSLCCQLFLEK